MKTLSSLTPRLLTLALGSALTFGSAVALADHTPGHADHDNTPHDNTLKDNQDRHEGGSVTHQAGAMIDEATVTASVKARLLADERTQGFDINVNSAAGPQGVTVMLEGTAPTWDSKRAATEVARQVNGVQKVKNNLVVTTDRTDNAQTLSAKTQDVFSDDDNDSNR